MSRARLKLGLLNNSGHSLEGLEGTAACGVFSRLKNTVLQRAAKYPVLNGITSNTLCCDVWFGYGQAIALILKGSDEVVA